jgi:hypothetical protein
LTEPELHRPPDSADPRASTCRIGLVLLSNRRHPQPSTRIALLNVLPRLSATGFDAVVLHEPETADETPDVDGLTRRALDQGVSAVIFQKVRGRSVLNEIAALRSAGISTLWMVCDLVDPAVAAAVDHTVCVTGYLRSLYPRELWPTISVVHDGIERPEHFKRHVRADRGDSLRPLSAVLVTSDALTCLPIIADPPAWLRITIVGRYPPASRPWRRLQEAWWQWWRLRETASRSRFISFLANPRISRVAWDPSGVYAQLERADIAIIPVDVSRPAAAPGIPPVWERKSENRLTLKMAMGLPVIASPLPSYRDVLQPGVNGLFATTRDEWMAALDALRDPVIRRTLGEQARECVLERFSVERQASLLIDVIRRSIERTAGHRGD